MHNDMKKLIFIIALCAFTYVSAQETNRVPRSWRWIGDHQVAFTYDFGRQGPDDFVLDAATQKKVEGAVIPAMSVFPGMPPGMSALRPGNQMPFRIQGAENLRYSPDSTKLAFTRNNDLWIYDVASKQETRLTKDGSDVILNGYASWVYYEEILGRASRYCAFWWSPDSKKIGFYRFDNTEVPFFPIYSPVGENADRSGLQLGYGQNAGGAVDLEGMSATGGSVRMTRYPKCGDPNPKVKVGIADVATGAIVWADFNEDDDQYFGTPFWGADSKAFFIQREPRIQNTLDLYAVSPDNGSKKHIYHETYDTWLDWISGMVFGRDGLYMVRSFETGWEQIYYLSYDGKTLRRLTSGDNWRVKILNVKEGKPGKKFDGSTSEILYSAERDSHVRTGLYFVCKDVVRVVSNPGLSVSNPSLSPDEKYVVASQGNCNTPDQVWLFDLAKPARSFKVADSAGPDFDPANPALPKIITMTTKDGLELPAMIVYPKNFDPGKKYPVHVDLYGGPDTPQVSDRYRGTNASQWYSDNGIIEVVADCRASGYNGRKGLDMIYEHLDELEVQDFVEWAEYLKKLPYVNGDKIGVEGFSFGGTMTALLVMKHSDAFHYGIAGGGVYEWALYDTHYTERFMSTPQSNPEGYERTKVTNAAKEYPVTDANDDGSVMLKLTHGTGDDNVHFQNTLKLVDALQKEGKKFELMIYPDGMHGYRGYQGRHFNEANRAFWLKYLKGE